MSDRCRTSGWPQALRTYTAEEASVSARRREVQLVMDRLNAEIGGRYRQGSASVDELLAAASRAHQPELGFDPPERLG